jgi:hypothetical protein
MRYSTIFRKIFDAAYASKNGPDKVPEAIHSIREELDTRLYIHVEHRFPDDKDVQITLLKKDPCSTSEDRCCFEDIVAAGIVWTPSNQRLQAYVGGQLGSLGTTQYSHEFLTGNSVDGSSERTLPFLLPRSIKICAGLRYLLLAELGDIQYQRSMEKLAKRPYPSDRMSPLCDSWPSNNFLQCRLLEIQMA